MPPKNVKMKDKKGKNKKKRILFFPYAHQFGSTAPLVEMARFLKQQGHEVLVAGEGPYMQLAQNVGLDTEKVYGVPYEVYRKAIFSGKYSEVFSPNFLHDMLQADELLIKKFGPDLIIHFLRFSIPITAHKYNIVAAGVSGINTTPWFAGPIEIPKLQPELRFLSIVKSDFLLSKIWRFGMEFVSRKNLSRLIKYLSEKDLYKIQKHHLELILGKDFVLFFDCDYIFRLTKNIPINSIVLGPIINNLVERPLNKTQLHQLEQWKKEGKYIVFVNLGSSTADKESITKMILSNNKNIKNRLAYVIAGFNEDLSTVNKMFKQNIIIDKIFNVREIGKYADILITHGGKGSLYDSLAYDMYPIVIPNSSEQELNGLVFQRHGLARVVYRNDIAGLPNILNQLPSLMHEFRKLLPDIRHRVLSNEWQNKLINLVNSI